MSVGPGEYTFAQQEKRRVERRRISIPAIIAPIDLAPFQTKLRDLSQSGFSASSALHLPIGTVCVLTLPERPSMEAKVTWWEGGLLGCAFTNLISAVTCDAILERWATSEPRH